eukprot:3557569-Amphidinium_carterae.3
MCIRDRCWRTQKANDGNNQMCKVAGVSRWDSWEKEHQYCNPDAAQDEIEDTVQMLLGQLVLRKRYTTKHGQNALVR